ncbi:CARDB domain-containing protein [Salinilacihabitans rarus]|uniref:CARDB domain-containing protein n=1 Tax=Salinilacihabitans rarus TaxID=2961596 RepID=UPI0020C8B5DA|nr:CARDB domain-containing protein [Salinilacihabitans rarus]
MAGALESEEYTRFREELSELLASYDEGRPAERAFAERAKAISQDRAADRFAADPDDLDSVDRYLLELETTNVNRAGALIGLGAGVASAETVDDVAEFVTELKAQEENLAAARRTATSTVEAATLPALPLVYGITVDDDDDPLPVGATTTLSITVGNAGDDAATDVSVAIETGDDVTVADSERTVSLDPGVTEQVSAAMSVEEAGDVRIRAVLSYDGDEFVETESLEVLSVEGFLERAGRRLETLTERIEGADASRGAQRRLLSSLAAAGASLERALEAWSAGDRRRTDDHLATATKQLGAFLNKLAAAEAGRGTGNGPGGGATVEFSAWHRTSFEVVATEVIDHLSRVRSARL